MWYLILMKSLTQPVSIVCEVDPSLTPGGTVDAFRDVLRLRLLPVKGGVCLIRGGVSRAVHAAPAGLALELLGCAEECARRLSVIMFAAPGAYSATACYWADRCAFYRVAARAVETDSRVLRMWGLS